MTATVERVFVDLDRTIFDTPKFFDDVWDAVASIHGVDPHEPKARASAHYIYNGDLYNYDFFEHLRAEGLLCSPEQLIARLRGEGRYVYPDVMPAWSALSAMAEPQILTYGGTDYQQLKIACCPELDAVPVVAVLEPKAEYFARELPDVPVLLLDDKDLAAELPKSVNFIRIVRTDDAGISRGQGSLAINSFTHLKEVLSLV